MQDVAGHPARVPFGLRDCATDSEGSAADFAYPGDFPSDDSDSDSFRDDEDSGGEQQGAAKAPGADGVDFDVVGTGGVVLTAELLGQGAGPGRQAGKAQTRRLGAGAAALGARGANGMGFRISNGASVDAGTDGGWGREAWSEIDERARRGEREEGNGGGEGGGGGGRGARGPGSQRRGLKAGRKKPLRTRKVETIPPGGGKIREVFVDINGIQQGWLTGPAKTSKMKPNPRSNSSVPPGTGKRMPAASKKAAKSGQTLTGAVIKPFTLPDGPITILRRPQSAGACQQQHSQCGADAPVDSGGYPREYITIPGIKPAKADACSTGDIAAREGGVCDAANGEHREGALKLRREAVLALPTGTVCIEAGFGFCDDDNSDMPLEDRIKAARQAADVAMAGLSMAKDELEDLPQPENPVAKSKKPTQGRVSGKGPGDSAQGFGEGTDASSPEKRRRRRKSRKGAQERPTEGQRGAADGGVRRSPLFQPRYLLTRGTKAKSTVEQTGGCRAADSTAFGARPSSVAGVHGPAGMQRVTSVE